MKEDKINLVRATYSLQVYNLGYVDLKRLSILRVKMSDSMLKDSMIRCISITAKKCILNENIPELIDDSNQKQPTLDLILKFQLIFFYL